MDIYLNMSVLAINDCSPAVKGLESFSRRTGSGNNTLGLKKAATL